MSTSFKWTKPTRAAWSAANATGSSAADRKVARVQAELDVRALEDLVNVLGSLDQGADVGVQDLGQAVCGAYPSDHGQTGGEVVPLALVELERGRPVGVHDGGGHEIGAAGPLQEVGRLLGVALGLLP